MAEGYDERGEPIGTMPVGEPVPQAQPVAPPQAAPPPPAARPGTMQTRYGEFRMPSAPPPGSDAGPNAQDWKNTNEYMAQMAKAGLMDKAQKDVDQAMRFLGMRGVEKDVQNGTPYAQALAKHLPYISWNNPAQAEAYSRVIQQSQPLSMQNLDGVRVLRTPRGDRIVPQSAIPQPPITSAQTIPLTNPQTGEPIAGHFATPSASGRGFTVHRNADTEPKLTPAQARLQLNDLIKEKRAEIDGVIYPVKGSKENQAAAQLEIGRLNTELKQLQAQRTGALKKPEPKKEGASAPAVPPKEKRTIGQVYQTPKGAHRWTADGWEPVS